jgi:hypothetical protein
VLSEDWRLYFGIRGCSRRKSPAQLFEKEVESTWHDSHYCAASHAADILQRMGAAAWRKNSVARASVNLHPIDFKQIFTFQDVPPFVLNQMPMQRWSRIELRVVLEHGERTSRVVARDFHAYFVAHDVERISRAALASRDGECCCRRTRRLLRGTHRRGRLDVLRHTKTVRPRCEQCQVAGLDPSVSPDCTDGMHEASQTLG